MRKRRFREKRPIRLGAMAPARDRTGDAPTYQQVLEKHGFLPRSARVDGWSLWQRVAEDRTVVRMAQEIERPKYKLASVTAGYQHTDKVLTTMSERQLAALKKRVGLP
jgi:hypothetical protein